MGGLKTVILAGGEGTRLRPLTLTRPKSLIPLGPRPGIDYLINQLSEVGFTDLIVTVNYLKEQLMHYIGDGSRFNVRVEYAVEPEGILLGTAGGVKLVSHLLDETFIVLQGDAFTTIDLRRALDFHRQSEADATIILKEVPDPWFYGVAKADSNGRITAFQEKPLKGEEVSNLASTGIYCMEPEALDYCSHATCDFAKDVFPQLLSEQRRVFGFVGEGFWADIGSLRGYLEANKRVVEKLAEKEARNKPGVVMGKDVAIGEKVTFKAPVLIEDSVSVAGDSQIGPYAVLKEGVKVGENSTTENSAILEGAILGSSCEIHGSIVGERAAAADRVIVYGSVIGPGSILGESARVKNGGRVWPGVRVGSNISVEGTLTLPTDHPFYFHSDVGTYIGVTASTIADLAKVLERVETRSIEFHLYRRDFERWIRDVFRSNVLAMRISSLRKEGLKGEGLRTKLTNMIGEWLDYSTERNQLLRVVNQGKA